VITAAVVLAGLRVNPPGGLSALDGVAIGLVLAWTLALTLLLVTLRGRMRAWRRTN
jgi:hypothetical protein